MRLFISLFASAIVTISARARHVDDDYADYSYGVSPAQSLASGLPEFQADSWLG